MSSNAPFGISWTVHQYAFVGAGSSALQFGNSVSGETDTVEGEPDKCEKDVQTLGFALAKGLIRGLTRCPNPSSKS